MQSIQHTPGDRLQRAQEQVSTLWPQRAEGYLAAASLWGCGTLAPSWRLAPPCAARPVPECPPAVSRHPASFHAAQTATLFATTRYDLGCCNPLVCYMR